MTAARRGLWILIPLLPILGSVIAFHFRSSETPWNPEAHPQRPEIRGGYVRVADFWIAEQEMMADAVSAVLGEPVNALPNGVACVSLQQARRYCHASGTRLPTEAEWILAARGSSRNAPFPWGWGPVPEDVAFNQADAPTKPGPRMPTGLRDMAGGVWEWTQEGRIKGGAWSERNPEVLRIDAFRELPEDYQGMDTGFRVIKSDTQI